MISGRDDYGPASRWRGEIERHVNLTAGCRDLDPRDADGQVGHPVQAGHGMARAGVDESLRRVLHDGLRGPHHPRVHAAPVRRNGITCCGWPERWAIADALSPRWTSPT